MQTPSRMPPKKDEGPVKKILLGRPSNNVKMGIVGLPNVGKSTFFNLLCNMHVAAENYPFCTVRGKRVPPGLARSQKCAISPTHTHAPLPVAD